MGKALRLRYPTLNLVDGSTFYTIEKTRTDGGMGSGGNDSLRPWELEDALAFVEDDAMRKKERHRRHEATLKEATRGNVFVLPYNTQVAY